MGEEFGQTGTEKHFDLCHIELLTTKKKKKRMLQNTRKADKLLSGSSVEIKIQLTNHQTETIITSHGMTFQAAFMPSAASLFC